MRLLRPPGGVTTTARTLIGMSERMPADRYAGWRRYDAGFEPAMFAAISPVKGIIMTSTNHAWRPSRQQTTEIARHGRPCWWISFTR